MGLPKNPQPKNPQPKEPTTQRTHYPEPRTPNPHLTARRRRVPIRGLQVVESLGIHAALAAAGNLRGSHACEERAFGDAESRQFFGPQSCDRHKRRQRQERGQQKHGGEERIDARSTRPVCRMLPRLAPSRHRETRRGSAQSARRRHAGLRRLRTLRPARAMEPAGQRAASVEKASQLRTRTRPGFRRQKSRPACCRVPESWRGVPDIPLRCACSHTGLFRIPVGRPISGEMGVSHLKGHCGTRGAQPFSRGPQPYGQPPGA